MLLHSLDETHILKRSKGIIIVEETLRVAKKM